MSKKEDNCQFDFKDGDCSSGTCAPVSPFSKEGALFLVFVAVLLAILFFALYSSGYI